MIDIIKEARNEVLFEKAIKCLRRYALPLVILLLIVTITYNIWSSHNEKIAVELGDKLYTASVTKDLEKKKELLQEVESSNHNYRYIAMLTLADLLQQNGQTEQAVALYNQLADGGNADRYIADAAKQRIMIIKDTDDSDNSIYYSTNRILQGFAAINKNDTKKGQEILGGLQESFDIPMPIKDLLAEINRALDNS